MKKLLLPLCLIFLAALSGLPAAARPPDRAPPLPALQPQVPEFSAAPPLRFDRLSAADGLSFSHTTAIVQDRQGFMWFGTRYGLNRFDGFDFTVHIPGTSGDILFANYMRNLYEDRAGNLWIANLVDLVRRDHQTGEFVHYVPDPADPKSLGPGQIWAIAEDAARDLWVSTTGGLSRYDPSTDTFTRFLPDTAMLSFLLDRRGGVWLGTAAYGLWHYAAGSPDQGEPQKYRYDPADPTSLSEDRVASLFEDHEGALWAGTWTAGLNRLDRASGKITRFQHDPEDPGSLSNNFVRVILEDSRGRLWVGTDYGLNLFDRATGRFFQYHYDPNDPHSLSSDSIWDIYEDRSGVIWFGTVNGISKLNETASSFTHIQQSPNQPSQGWGAQSVTVLDPHDPPGLSDNAVSSVYQDRQGILWIGTNTTYRGELNRLDRVSSATSGGGVTVYQHNPDDPTSLGRGPVYVTYEDRAGMLWVGTLNGLDRFNPQTQSFQAEEAFRGQRVTAIVEDQRGALWVGYWGGISRREPGASAFASVPLDRELELGVDRVYAIYPDRAGAVWVSFGNLGLYRLDPAAGGGTELTVHRFPQDRADPRSPGVGTVMSFYEDAGGILWMGSVEGGLVRYDRDTQTFARYVPNAGPDRYVSCVQGDAQGFLWMGTELGLARFDPRTETFAYFDARDGLVIGEESEGSACFQNQQGEMFFGSSQGLNTFFPDQIRDNPNPPVVAITAVNLKNQPLRTNLRADEQIKLSYRENYLSFDFAALDYNAPAKNQYAYKMEGLDADWVEADTRRHADYPDLKPGTYTFRVKASNNSGVWNEEGASVHLTISPPFWQTWWFLGLVGVVLAGAVAGGVRLRLKRAEARSRDLEAQVASRTGELVALNEIATVLNRPLDLQGVLSDALNKTLKVTRIEAGGIYLLDEKTQVLTIAAHQGFSPQFVSEIDGLQAGEGFSGLVIRSGETLVVGDVSADPRLTRMVVRDEGFHSLAVVPLKSRDQVRGTLFALTHGHREFTGQDVQLLESIGHQVGAAIESARLYEDTKNQVAQLNALHETTKAVASTLELDSLLNLIIQQATTLLQADGGFINLVDKDRRSDEVVAVAGLAPPVIGERVPLEASLSGWATLHNQATISNRIPNDDRVARTVRSWVMETHIQSAAVAPLTVRDQVMGTLVVIGQEGKKGRFVQSDLDQLVAFANQAAIAIENARLYEQSRELAVVEERRRQELEALLSADDRMQRYLHQDQVLQALVDVAVDTLRADKSVVIWWDEKREKLVMRVTRGFDPQAIRDIYFVPGEGIIAGVAQSGEPALVEDSLTDPRRNLENPRSIKFAQDEGIRSFMFFPIIIGEEVVGVFNVSYRKPHAAGAEEQRLFQALTQRAALQIENARLYERSQELAVLEERSRLARELHDAVTQTLFSASLVAEALPTTWERDPQEGRGLLQELRGLCRGALAEMRTLLLELRPARLVETRLDDLLRQLGEAASGREGIPVAVQVEGRASPLPPDVHIALYRIAQEALNNVVKHARAQRVEVRLRYRSPRVTNHLSDASREKWPQPLTSGPEGPFQVQPVGFQPPVTEPSVLLSISDDGRGFEPARVPHDRLGLGNMQERAQAIGAHLTIESQPGQGTQITVLWEAECASRPLAKEDFRV